MEILEVVCERTGNPLGISLPRAEAIATEAWCRSTNVFVMNSKGELLCHQRSLQKERGAGAWSTHLGGHVGVGETFETNALKELEEEAGITVSEHALISWRTTKIVKACLWAREFVTILDLPIEAFTPQEGEVQSFAWKSLENIVTESTSAPENWYAGTHDIVSEYMCMRAVITALSASGIFPATPELHVWQDMRKNRAHM